MYNWPFSTRGSRVDAAPTPPGHLPDFNEFVRDDAVLKVWFPEKISVRLDWLSGQQNVSRPDLVRSMLFEHLYGRVALLRLQEFARQRLAAIREAKPVYSSDSDIKKSPQRGVNLEMLGKSVDDFKLHLPARLKADTVDLARMHSLTPSNYVRKVMVQVLLGGRFHADWQQALGNLPQDLAALERE